MMNEPLSRSVLTTTIDYSNPTTSCPIERVREQIRRRAYELFETRGRESGFELVDWLAAEREIKHHVGQS